jgi:ATP-dependent DNA helicase RecG
MIHPEYRILREEQGAVTDDSLTPVYPATEGVQQGRLRNLTDQALEAMLKEPPPELLPQSVTDKLGMPSLADAISYLHRPPPDADVAQMQEGRHPCQQRLAFEELLAHYLSLRSLRSLAETEGAFALTHGQGRVDQFVADLPFELTGAQARVVDEIMVDLSRPHPMMRLPESHSLWRSGGHHGTDRDSGRTALAKFLRLVSASRH